MTITADASTSARDLLVDALAHGIAEAAGTSLSPERVRFLAEHAADQLEPLVAAHGGRTCFCVREAG